MKIIYEDKEDLVVEKPVGLLCEPDEKGQDVFSVLKAEHNITAYGVHRLDRATGGVFLCAKTQSAVAELSEQLKTHSTQKIYYCVVHGIPDPMNGQMEDLLYFDRRSNKAFVVKKERRGAKTALLSYETVKTGTLDGKPVSVVRVMLHTGRTHQIRVQFASRKMPLLGDGKYGSRCNKCTTALWSTSLTFVSPATKKAVTAESLPPDKFPWDLLLGTEQTV